MKKIAISLVALAAVSSFAFANESRSFDVRESDSYFGKYPAQDNAPSAGANEFALALMDDQDGVGLSAFERMKMLSEQNAQGRH
jgi:hypothetical protein